MEAYKLILGDQVFRCNASCISTVSHLVKNARQRSGIANKLLRLRVVAPVLDEVEFIDSDEQLSNLIQIANSLQLKVIRLAIHVLDDTVTQCAQCSELIEWGVGYFTCLWCPEPDSYCIQCEPLHHTHPLIKITLPQQLQYVQEARRKLLSAQESKTVEMDRLSRQVSVEIVGKSVQAAVKYQMQFVSFYKNGVTPGTMVEGGCIFYAGWRVRNNGDVDWTADLTLEMVKGDNIMLMSEWQRLQGLTPSNIGSELKEDLEVPLLKAGSEGQIVGRFIAPMVTEATSIQSFWRIKRKGCVVSDEHSYFGQMLKLDVDVIPPNMSLLERQHRWIEQLGFKDKRKIAKALTEAHGNTEKAVFILQKDTQSS